MLVTDINNVKIYNLSGGKSVPEWLSNRKQKNASKKHADNDRRIELIQDFDMPGVASCIAVSPDGQYILATGTYKPRVKCFEVCNLSQKFERCFDSEVEKFAILSDDYGKVVFLHADRYVEIHAAHGRHYRLRVPCFGRDLVYHKPSCDLLVVGASPDIYRLNLERGQFLLPYTNSSASAIDSITVNPEHQLICAGTQEGTLEAWDHRDRSCVGTLDVAAGLQNTKEVASVTALEFKNGLTIAAGTSTGHVLLYDIRARNPLAVKDHLNQLPIKKIRFQPEQKSVYSLDSAMLKIWDETTLKQKACIEAVSNFNDFAHYPGSGLFLFAQEDTKMLPYYVPIEGPAPKWCSFLDNLVEEMDSEAVQNVYDDYKFITKQELAELKLDHLEGTRMLRAYMHGFFIDIRLYNKAKSVSETFVFDGFRKEKIRKHIEAARPARIQLKTALPEVNKELAQQLMEEEHMSNAKRSAIAKGVLSDERFKTMFENPDFEIDKEANEYRILSMVLKRVERDKARRKENVVLEGPGDDDEKQQSTDDDLYSEKSESESEDEKKESDEEIDNVEPPVSSKNGGSKKVTSESFVRKPSAPPMQQDDKSNGEFSLSVEEGANFNIMQPSRQIQSVSLGKRVTKLEHNTTSVQFDNGIGRREITFTLPDRKKGNKTDQERDRSRQQMLKKHKEERRQVIRSAKGVIKKMVTKKPYGR
ncbi:nucleolar protein 10 [Anopheles ziemanni]|uniref:nucleolar protein 10 n=1 Tax=Anopheles coustani TaxID=139045 RepID=UPI0026599D25|nr:nucleolar protein 10 [Anopheles coustani]XP_058175143.1 nucleolar protein 10 [Anopheles ziemanni]